MTEKTPVVTHLTRVGLTIAPDPEVFAPLYQAGIPTADMVRELGKAMAERAERVAAMMDLMAARGFVFESAKQTIFGYSNQVEAFEIKRDLIAAGFKDREFQIVLEYTRGWGML